MILFSLEVYDVLGKQIEKIIYNNISKIELNTNKLKSGVYYIKLNSLKKLATIKLIIKKILFFQSIRRFWHKVSFSSSSIIIKSYRNIVI